MKNMLIHLPRLLQAGLTVYLVKDAPLLSETTSLEKCAYFKFTSGVNSCSVSLLQDTHTRLRQSNTFDNLADYFSGDVFSLDIIPILYGNEKVFNPIYTDGSYRMFDRHHLTERASLELLPYFQNFIH